MGRLQHLNSDKASKDEDKDRDSGMVNAGGPSQLRKARGHDNRGGPKGTRTCHRLVHLLK